MKLVYKNYFLNHIKNHLHPLQVENCDSNSRIVVDEDGNGKFRLERDNAVASCQIIGAIICASGRLIYYKLSN